MSPANSSHFTHLQTLCASHFLPSEKDAYAQHAAPWSIWADRHPQLILVPATLSELQSIIAYLYPITFLDFCIRNTGTGGSSASDVCISMAIFKTFHFDSETKVITVGAGLSFGELDILMEKADPSYGVVGARCTWVGVTGGTLVGGLSWLSGEYGLISDPQNFLDAQIVLHDGRVVWAAAHEAGFPDLMWALRGGGGNFGVVTALKFRVRKVTSKIFGAIVHIPYSSLEETSRAVAEMNRRQPSDPKVAMHITNGGPGMGMPDQGSKPDIMIVPVSFHGEAHARSEAGLAWIWSLPGAREVVSFEKSLCAINALGDSFKSYQGTNKFWASAPLISGIDDETLVRAWKWYEETYGLFPGFAAGSTVLLEFMPFGAFNSVESSKVASPRGKGQRHVMQTLLGCPADSPENTRELAMGQMKKVQTEVGGEHATEEYHPGFLHEWNDVKGVYGENWTRLKEAKEKYDPKGRFDKSVDLQSAR